MPKRKTLITAKYNTRYLTDREQPMVILEFCESFDPMAKSLKLDYLLETIDLLKTKYDQVVKTTCSLEKGKIIDFPNQSQQKKDSKSKLNDKE